MLVFPPSHRKSPPRSPLETGPGGLSGGRDSYGLIRVAVAGGNGPKQTFDWLHVLAR